MVNCNICGEEFSRPDSLSRHLKRKNSCMRKNSIVGHQNTCSVPYKSETVMRTGVKRQYRANNDRSVFEGENTIPVNNGGKRKTFIDSIITKDGGLGAGKVQNQQHNKTLNPKFSALIDSIIDEEPSSKYLSKDNSNISGIVDHTSSIKEKEKDFAN